jgi:hypothetical protein
MFGRSRTLRGGLGVGTLAVATAVALLIAVPLQAKPAAIPAGNLVQNPGFEDGPGRADDVTTPPVVWQSGGTPSVWVYVAGVGYERPTMALAAKIGGGANFLSGGQGAAGTPGTITKTASQSIDVAGAATEIDAGAVAANLSAYLGGYTSSEDTARVDAKFLGANAAPLGTLRVGPVTRDQRARQTTLLKRSASAPVPKGTRSIAIVITMFAPETGSKVYAYVDNVSLTLVKATPQTAAKATLAVACSGKTLVVKVRPAAGSAVRSVKFLVNGKSVGVDKKAPYTVRIATRGLAAQVKVTARVLYVGKTVVLKKAIKRC